MASNQIKRTFANGLRRLLAHEKSNIEAGVPYFRKRSFQVGHPCDLRRALEHADPDTAISSTAIKAWFDAKAIPRGKNRDSLILLLGEPARLLLDGEDITHLLNLTAEAPFHQAGVARNSDARRRLEDATAMANALLGKLKDLGELLK